MANKELKYQRFTGETYMIEDYVKELICEVNERREIMGYHVIQITTQKPNSSTAKALTIELLNNIHIIPIVFENDYHPTVIALVGHRPKCTNTGQDLS